MADHDDDWILFRLQRLSPGRFEELCFALLKAKGHRDVRHLGAAGSERGVDVLSTDPDGRIWVTQCKRYRSLSPGDVKPEIRTVITEPPSPPPAVYHLVATCNVSRATEEALQDAARVAPFPLEIAHTWAATELVALLRDDHPEIRRNFIEPAGKLPFWNVPNRNDYFTGREELLEELAACLEAASSVALTQTISGLGGVGKTQMAIEYCHRHRSAYDAGVYWVDASSAENLKAEYASLALALKLVGREVPVDEASAAFRRELAARPGWLVVLDNVDEVDGLRPLVPPTTGGHVLVTTRVERPGLGRGSPLAVDVLPQQQAVEFLLDRGQRDASELDAVATLARALGRLPLALEQAAAYLARHPIEVPIYLASFEKLNIDLLERKGPELGDYHATVATTWELSFQKVEESHPAAAEALRACGFLAPDRIPLELFTGTGRRLGEALGMLANECRDDPLVTHERLVEPLTRYSLARFDPGSGGRLSIHRLVQEVIRHRLRREVLEAEVLEHVHAALESCFPQEPESPLSWPACRLWFPHVKNSLAAWLKKVEVPGWDPTGLWIQAGLYAWASGRATEARAFDEATLAVRRRALGEEHPDTLMSMNNLAETLRDLGDTSRARELHETALAVRRRVLGEEHPDTLNSMSNLAALLWDLGNASGARKLEEATLAVRRRVVGEEHPSTLTAMNNLAETLRVLGNASGARKLHEAALAISRRVLGEEHPDTLMSMDNLAVTLRTLGEVSAARTLHETALAISRRVLGEEHPDTLISMHNLCATQEVSDGIEVDQRLVEELLSGVRKLPERAPIRVAAESRWLKE